MGNWFQSLGNIFSALFSGDASVLYEATREVAIWPLVLITMLATATLMLHIYRLSPWIERNLEKSIMVSSYLIMGGIIFVEVIRRFVFHVQAPWSTTLPPFLFLIMTWFGCSYNVKLRTHLSFNELRSVMPRKAQFGCLMLDALLWIVMAWVIVVTSLRVVTNSASNFQIMLGTDNVLQWWFLISVPLAFTFLVGRVLENVLQDIDNYKKGDPLIKQAIIGGK